jgi:membrane-associated phospholipid phosphatase
MVVAAQLLRRWLKLSLHAAFAVFAVALWWPNAGGAAVVLLLAAAVSWSRLALRRHTGAEVTAGLLAAAAAGWIFAAFVR